MKKSKKLKSVLAGVGLVSLLSIMLFSCLKDHNSYITAPTSLLMVVQGSPDVTAEDLYLNSNRVTGQPLNYQDHIGYFNAYSGNREVILNSFNTQTKIASDTVTLKAGYTYSLFLANTYTKPDFILLTDTINTPSTGNAAVRLVNVSPDAGAVDLAINNTNVLVTNKSYKGASAFQSVSGNIMYNFEVRKSGTTTVLAKLDSVQVRAGVVYTVWLRGLAAGTSPQNLSVGIIANAYF